LTCFVKEIYFSFVIGNMSTTLCAIAISLIIKCASYSDKLWKTMGMQYESL